MLPPWRQRHRHNLVGGGVLDAGLPFAAAGSCMNPGRTAAPSGGRSVAASPPRGREVAGGEPPRNNVRGPPRNRYAAAWARSGRGEPPRRLRDAASLPHRRQAARLRRGISTVRGLSPGRGQGGAQEATAEAVASPQAGRGAGRRGWRRSQREAPPPSITLGKVAAGLCGNLLTCVLRA